MAITITTPTGAITAKELLDGYSKGIGPGGPIVEKRYLVPWAQSDALANALMGLTQGVGGIAGTIIRQAPHQCPESTNLFCLSVGPIEGWGAPVVDAGRPRWEQAVVPATYGVPTFQLGGPLNTLDPYNLMNFDNQEVYPYCSQSIDYDSESYTIDKEWYYGAGSASGKPIVDSKQVVNVAVATMSLTVHRVPFLPTQKIFDLLKCVNDSKFLGQPAGTVLFDRIRTDLNVNTDGTATQELAYSFRWRKPGHNNVPDPANGATWVAVNSKADGSGVPIYTPADLRPLIFGVDLS